MLKDNRYRDLQERHAYLAALGNCKNPHEDWEMLAIADELEEFYGVVVGKTQLAVMRHVAKKRRKVLAALAK